MRSFLKNKKYVRENRKKGRDHVPKKKKKNRKIFIPFFNKLIQTRGSEGVDGELVGWGETIS